ncbi:hypothetical protein [Pelagibius sp. Alg239-R121]|uniref:hypothetical protein n=1 Tax=Pelagibius sp. Alg239-R121 TaxID=2993448 RepID=UPI0024A69E44|nr:hypothetical protein [Pelagibius sp. Alg239-R121]
MKRLSILFSAGFSALACLAVALAATMPDASWATSPVETNHSTSGPQIAGLRLGMTRLQFLEIYPDAEWSLETPQIHCHGRPLSSDFVERGQAGWNSGHEWLSVKFHRVGNSLRLNSIEYRNPIDFDAEGFEALRNQLDLRFGTHSRLLIPAKLDAARLLVGFEWSESKNYNMTYRIHHDTHGSGNELFATYRLTDWFPGSSVQESGDRQQRSVYAKLRNTCTASRRK